MVDQKATARDQAVRGTVPSGGGAMPFSAKVGTKPRVEHTEAGRGCRGINEEEDLGLFVAMKLLCRAPTFACQLQVGPW